MGYFAQHAMELLDADATVLETLQATFPLATIGSMKALAGAFGFSGDDGGEAVPRALGRREGARRPREDALRPAELPRPRRADEPPRHGDQGDADEGARRLRRDDALRVARPALPRARCRTACSRWRTTGCTPTAAGTRSTSRRAGMKRRGLADRSPCQGDGCAGLAGNPARLAVGTAYRPPSSPSLAAKPANQGAHSPNVAVLWRPLAVPWRSLAVTTPHFPPSTPQERVASPPRLPRSSAGQPSPASDRDESPSPLPPSPTDQEP